jgi:hypothetical protein
MSSCNQILHYSELSLEVQGGQYYFWFVEGTCIIVLYLSSLSLSVFIRCILVLNITSEAILTLLLTSVFSLGENEEKANTIQPRFLCFSNLHDKASDKLKIGGFGLPSIHEEVEDLNVAVVLCKRTRSGKAAASAQAAPEQPSVPKKKRKAFIIKLNESSYIAEEEEEKVVATTELVTREIKKKKVEDAATLANIGELAKGIEVPA